MKHIERIAYILLLVAVAFAFRFPDFTPYVASVGAAGIAVCRLKERYEGKNIRLKRLIRQRHLVGIAYVVGAGLMFKELNYWLVAFMIAVILDLYTMFVYSREEAKQDDNLTNQKPAK